LAPGPNKKSHTHGQRHADTHAHVRTHTNLLKMVTHIRTCLSSPVILALGMGMTTTCWGATLGGITIPYHTNQSLLRIPAFNSQHQVTQQ